MQAISILEQLLRYDDWANRSLLQSLQHAGRAEAPVPLLAHIVAAEWLWLGRLREEPQAVPVWPDWDLRRCAVQLEGLLTAWRELLATSDLDRVVTYRNSKGEPWRNRARDIVLHVALHSSYHRGQIAQDERRQQRTPAYTDYVHCVRQGFLD